MSDDGPTPFDAVIVGAGPAGSATAIQLARAGWSVAVVERQGFPRRKVCGECIAASNLPLLHALGIGDAFDAAAGPALTEVTLMAADAAVTAALPPAGWGRHRWGRALGRETLDSLLLEQARAAGATVLQPWALQDIGGAPGHWHCDIRSPQGLPPRRLQARVMVDAHGAWQALPAQREQQRRGRSAADLFAFKAGFQRSALRAGAIAVLALDGGYGGMVVGDGDLTTLACCIRRDRLNALRSRTPGQAVGEVVEAFLRRECAGVRDALRGAERAGPWLTAGPLATGVRLDAVQGIFSVGNAAGEAHPILGEGMSMALQSAVLLCRELLGASSPSQPPLPSRPSPVPGAAEQAAMQRRYVAAWRHDFLPRLRLAAAFAHVAMRPAATALLLQAARHWPGLLTHGARWGGKVRPVEAMHLAPAWPAGARVAPKDAGPSRPSNKESA